jgi:2-(1,2-epoxy-1,2-dihydrophenyl)acetyl-CoA isomerase
MDTAGMTVQRLDHAVVLTLDRPRRRNALTVEVVMALREQIDQVARTDARLVVVTGTAPTFCAGGDLGQLSQMARGGATLATETIYSNFQALVRAIHDCPVPVLAAVNGDALGAGLDLALACDLRIAAETAGFASTWIGVGLVPGMGGAHVLPRLIGGARAAELLLLGTKLTATEALRWGLVSDVVPADELLATAGSMAERLSRLPATGVRLTKAALRRGLDAGLDAELATLGAVQGGLLAGEDFQALAERFATRP